MRQRHGDVAAWGWPMSRLSGRRRARILALLPARGRWLESALDSVAELPPAAPPTAGCWLGPAHRLKPAQRAASRSVPRHLRSCRPAGARAGDGCIVRPQANSLRPSSMARLATRELLATESSRGSPAPTGEHRPLGSRWPRAELPPDFPAPAV